MSVLTNTDVALEKLPQKEVKFHGRLESDTG